MSQILRADVPEEETWDLTHIFVSDEEWEEAFKNIERILNAWTEKTLLMENAKELLDSLISYDRLLVELDQVTSYSMYKFSEDSTDTMNQKMMGRSRELIVKSQGIKIDFTHRILKIPEDSMKRYMEEVEEIKEFTPFLDSLEEMRKHSLPLNVEKTLAALNDTLESPDTTFLTVTASDMKFEPVKDVNGKTFPVSLHMYMTQVETSPDTILRRNAFKSLTNGLKKYKHGLAHSLSTEINKNVALAKLRGYPSALDMLLQYSTPANNQFYSTNSDLTVELFEQILDTFRHELSPHMQRYARLRKKQLGLDKLLFSDVKAPLDPEFNPSISYKEAGEIITAAVGVLGEEYQEQMEKVFKDRWVYRGDNIGRRMIAFGGGVHGVHGYSFYPWGGSLFDLLLLGHELGHTLHYTLSSKNQRIVNNNQSLLFAEAPSTMVEHLIVEYLRNNRDDDRLHRWLNMYLMMSYHHNCVTHILEAELLRRLYKMVENNSPLTTSIINETKGEILSEFWGDTVEIDEGAKLTWMRQPHYYMGLYPFAYSVGISASTVIANRIKEEGLSVGKQWTNVLKKGGSMPGFDLYKMVGVDMTTTENLKKTITYVGTIVDELEKSF